MASHRAAAGDGTSSLLAIITAGHEEGWPHVDATDVHKNVPFLRIRKTRLT